MALRKFRRYSGSKRSDGQCSLMDFEDMHASLVASRHDVGDSDFMAIPDKDIVKYVPYALKQVNLREAEKFAAAGIGMRKHKVETKWEPDCMAMKGWKLSELSDVHVIRLFQERKNLNNGSPLYVLTESGRWYYWAVDRIWEVFQPLSLEEIKNSRVSGLRKEDWLISYSNCAMGEEGVADGEDGPKVSDWFAEALTGYVLGGPEYSGTMRASLAVRRLRKVARERGRRLRTLHGEAYLSMMNDLWDVWKMLCESDGFEEYGI